jgi:hypothetical protein
MPHGVDTYEALPNRTKQFFAVIPKVPIYLVSLPLLLIFMVFVRTLDGIYRLLPYGRSAFFPTSLFPWAGTLEKNWFKIRKELDALLLNLDAVETAKLLEAIPGLQYAMFSVLRPTSTSKHIEACIAAS